MPKSNPDVPIITRACACCGTLFSFRGVPSRMERRRFCSRRCLTDSQRGLAERVCEQCGNTFWIKPNVVQHGKGRFCSLRCSFTKAMPSGEQHRWWKGGRFVDARGYVWLYRPGHPMATPGKKGYVKEHRMVLHDAGIAVPPGYAIHHVNRDKADNRLVNLTLLPITDHGRLHSQDQPRS